MMPVPREHALRRCLLTELGVVNRLSNKDSYLCDGDELCEQLYMDVLGYGINSKCPTGVK